MAGLVAEVIPHEEVVLIKILKRTLDEPATRQLVDQVQTQAAQRPVRPIVLDMQIVKFIPSAVLGMLVQMAKSLEITRQPIALIHVDDRVRQVMRVTRLDQILAIHSALPQLLATGIATPKNKTSRP